MGRLLGPIITSRFLGVCRAALGASLDRQVHLTELESGKCLSLSGVYLNGASTCHPNAKHKENRAIMMENGQAKVCNGRRKRVGSCISNHAPISQKRSIWGAALGLATVNGLFCIGFPSYIPHHLLSSSPSLLSCLTLLTGLCLD